MPLPVNTDKVYCKCKKSKCINNRCDCFNIGLICGKNCHCYDCENLLESHEREEAIEKLKYKNKCF